MKKLIIITVLFFALVNYCFANPTTKKVIVVDAGSSHTTVYVYTYQPHQPLPISLQTTYKKTVTPGISSLPIGPLLENYLSQLLKEANSKFPDNVPLYFYATGGMRLLPSNTQEQYFNATNNWIKKNSKFHVLASQTLLGEMEGVYNWVTLNYLLNNFDQNRETAGMLDLGGASTQIAYAIQDKNLASLKDTVNLTIGNQHYQVYAKSYLGLGQDQSHNQFSDNASCSPVEFPISSEEKGTGNFSQCQLDVTTLINGVHHVREQTPTSIPQQMPFYLVSAFYYEAAAEPIHLLSNYTIAALKDKGLAFCHRTWDDLTHQYPKENFLYMTCFNAAYQTVLLHEGYGFDLEKTFIPTNKIGKNDIDWTLGVALLHAG